MKEVLTLLKQEQQGDYNFFWKTAATQGFVSLFSDEEEMREVVRTALKMTTVQGHPDFLQRFSYGTDVFCFLSNAENGAKMSDFADGFYPQVTFLLPSEY